MKKLFEGERRKQLIAVGTFLGASMVAAWILLEIFSPKRERRVEELPAVKIEEETLEEESFRKKYGERLVELERELTKLQRELKKLEKENKKLKEKLTEESKKREEPKRVNILTGEEVKPPPPPPPPIAQVPPPPTPQASPNRKPVQERTLTGLIGIEKAEKKEEVKEAKKPKVEKKPKRNIIPAGAFVKGVLLSGLDAPTAGKAQTSPHPVLIRIVDKAILPNLWKADIKDCFVIGSGYGDLSAERAYIRLETLSCIKKDGTAITKAVNGYVAGEDGKIGLAGRVVTKQGQILARTLLAGFVEGVAKAFSTSRTTVSVSPQGAVSTIQPGATTQVAIASGFSKAAEKLAEFYMKLANEMYPVVEINAGRNVDLVFLSPIVFGEEEKEVVKR